jgi:flavorubredoxin
MLDFTQPVTDEIAPDVFRICLYSRAIDLQFNFFLVKDEQPLLFTTGLRSTFPVLRDAVSKLIDPAEIRWIGFSHFESDECGALNQWLSIAPKAQPVCSFVSAMVNVNDFSDRAPKGMQDGEVLSTGRHRFRFCSTAQLPHGWDAGVLFEETRRTLFCSDLLHHDGNGEALTQRPLEDRIRAAMSKMQAGPLANYIPYTRQTGRIVSRLADLKPQTLAIMHGSSFAGDGRRELLGYADAMHDILGAG